MFLRGPNALVALAAGIFFSGVDADVSLSGSGPVVDWVTSSVYNEAQERQPLLRARRVNVPGGSVNVPGKKPASAPSPSTALQPLQWVGNTCMRAAVTGAACNSIFVAGHLVVQALQMQRELARTKKQLPAVQLSMVAQGQTTRGKSYRGRAVASSVLLMSVAGLVLFKCMRKKPQAPRLRVRVMKVMTVGLPRSYPAFKRRDKACDEAASDTASETVDTLSPKSRVESELAAETESEPRTPSHPATPTRPPSRPPTHPPTVPTLPIPSITPTPTPAGWETTPTFTRESTEEHLSPHEGVPSSRPARRRCPDFYSMVTEDDKKRSKRVLDELNIEHTPRPRSLPRIDTAEASTTAEFFRMDTTDSDGQEDVPRLRRRRSSEPSSPRPRPVSDDDDDDADADGESWSDDGESWSIVIHAPAGNEGGGSAAEACGSAADARFDLSSQLRHMARVVPHAPEDGSCSHRRRRSVNVSPGSKGYVQQICQILEPAKR